MESCGIDLTRKDIEELQIDMAEVFELILEVKKPRPALLQDVKDAMRTMWAKSSVSTEDIYLLLDKIRSSIGDAQWKRMVGAQETPLAARKVTNVLERLEKMYYRLSFHYLNPEVREEFLDGRPRATIEWKFKDPEGVTRPAYEHSSFCRSASQFSDAAIKCTNAYMRKFKPSGGSLRESVRNLRAQRRTRSAKGDTGKFAKSLDAGLTVVQQTLENFLTTELTPTRQSVLGDMFLPKSDAYPDGAAMLPLSPFDSASIARYLNLDLLPALIRITELAKNNRNTAARPKVFREIDR